MTTVNKPKVLLAVMAHADPAAEKMYWLHMPYWKAMADDIITIMPMDKQFKNAVNPLIFGRAAHNGPDAIKRFRWIENKLLELCKQGKYQKAIFFEYDSVALDSNFEPHLLSNTLFGNMFERSMDDEDPRYKARKFFHPPILFTPDILQKLVAISNSITIFEEQGMWDRWLGLQVQKMKVQHSGYGHLGYSQNTIETHHYPELIEAVKNGAIYFHGVKSPETLKLIVDTRKEYLEAQKRKKILDESIAELAQKLSVDKALEIKSSPTPAAPPVVEEKKQEEKFHVEQSTPEPPANKETPKPKSKGRPKKYIQPVEPEGEPDFL